MAKLEEASGNSRQALITLNEESLASVKETGGEVNYGFLRVQIKIYRGDQQKPNLEQVVANEAEPEKQSKAGYESDCSLSSRESDMTSGSNILGKIFSESCLLEEKSDLEGDMTMVGENEAEHEAASSKPPSL